MTQCIALIVAAGRGRRCGGDTPKQYRDIGGEPVLRRTLRAFISHPRIGGVRTVIHPDDRENYQRAAKGLDLLAPVLGGKTRQESVRLGLESLKAPAPETVLIHDAARPFVDRDLVLRVLDALEDAPGAIPALAVTDTIKRGRNGRIEGTVERDGLWRAQTPQGFHYAAILKAHIKFAGREMTDDAALAEQAGLEIALVQGDEKNIKLTPAEDLLEADRKLAAKKSGGEVRTGLGFDVHRFRSGDAVTLCGVKIPHDHALEGHSDADVALHALTDALLGALGCGDIGEHFPPSDPRWRGAPSEIFLAKAGALAAEKGARISNLDLTVICEFPKIGPYRSAMGEKIAEILNLDSGQIGVKATTTEKLGFTGRGEGIAAQAIATVVIDKTQ
ncbi:MAG TPA: bifunctional 2-C-methyl-D-erythritol 4-phosphate cytidylyltransferase/2-C-methyl-D-erythritol 2,4-cyclodiphosphate synthase [Rhodospirillales bacterium]|nr:bifunctional 2-C-methyl-D-erythritol 4-phosphate cytidylyltransferase/2-C-methyl-D-erythritol 2,4-cyclodiphosphate synthase [Rhodospirillales bacterium]